MMTKRELIDIIELLFEVINDLYARGPGAEEKKQLDGLADTLDRAQNRLVKLMIRENDARYVELTEELGAVNSRIKQDLIGLGAVNKLLDEIRQATDLVANIVLLFGVVA